MEIILRWNGIDIVRNDRQKRLGVISEGLGVQKTPRRPMLHTACTCDGNYTLLGILTSSLQKQSKKKHTCSKYTLGSTTWMTSF